MTVRYRLEWRQMPWLQGLAFVVFLLVQEGGENRAVDLALAVAVLAVAFGAMCALLRRSGVELTPETLTIHGFGHRVVPWYRVGEVTTRRLLGTTTPRVRIDGVWVNLRVPQHTPFLAPDPRFAEKLATIERYRDAALATGRPPAPTAPR